MKLIITERKKKKRKGKREKHCQSKANSEYGSETSLYRSMALSRCRKGKIWKEALQAGVDEALLEEQLMLELEALDDLGDDTATLEETDEHVCEACLYELLTTVSEDVLEEAEYKGRKVPLRKPMKGDIKKKKVYVRNPKTGKVKKIEFGDPNMRIKKSNPSRRKSFRARHKCSQKKDPLTAGYWSCKAW